MRRVASVWAAAAALAISGCGESRSAAAPFGGSAGCANCHTGPGEAPPFRDPSGLTDPAQVTVGAHDRHLSGTFTAPLACAQCHTTPRSVSDPGHLEDAPGDVSFGTLARTGGATPSYSREPQPGCQAVYCHGNFPGGNAGNRPVWTAARANSCGTCHALPPPSGAHPDHDGKSFNGEPITCATCHGQVLPSTHVNGVKNVVLPAFDPRFKTCAQACHQPRSWLQ